MIPLNQRFVEKFKQQAKIPTWTIDHLVKSSNQDSLRFVETLIHDNWLSRESAGRIFADEQKIAYVNLSKVQFQPQIVKKIPRELAEKYKAIPISQIGATITIAMAQPDDFSAVTSLRQILMMPVSIVFSFPDEIAKAITVNYESEDNLDLLIQKLDIKNLGLSGALDPQQVDRIVGSKYLIDLANSILLLALKENASDVHIEPKKHNVLVRFRIDGFMIERFSLPKEFNLALAARYKVMANLDVIERRKPQDGRISFELSVEKTDIRFASVPTMHGEKLVMRILGSRLSYDMLQLDLLGIFPEILQPLKKVLASPDGLLLVSGPTGSGKTTTLYATLNYVNHPGVNVVTIEDPIEYENPTINQIMVNTKEGRTFENVLKAVLRQDPDIILLGEIRDVETARIVSQAALTGHLVLSTIHTGSALQAVTRLVDIGVERFIVAPSIIGVMGQRLVRKLCEYCKKAYKPESDYLRQFFYWPDNFELPVFYKADGCHHCNSIGFKGRMGIHEFLQVDTTIRNLILQGKAFQEIHSAARQSGFKDIRYDGFRKALLGLTTIEEIIRVTSEHED